MSGSLIHNEIVVLPWLGLNNNIKLELAKRETLTTKSPLLQEYSDSECGSTLSDYTLNMGGPTEPKTATKQ